MSCSDGAEYTLPQNLDRLRGRSLERKRGLAMREFALGIEGLERFVRREPLRRIRECVFGILALESEPGDPQLCAKWDFDDQSRRSDKWLIADPPRWLRRFQKLICQLKNRI